MSNLWQSNSIQEIKHQIIGELVDPWPVPWIGNLMQCFYPVSDTFVDNLSLYSAASSVLACTKMTCLLTSYFQLARLEIAASILS